MSTALIPMRSVVLLAVGLVMAPLPVAARITKSRPSASSSPALTERVSSLLAPFYSMVIGSGIEYQTDDEQTEYGFPLLIEYNVTQRFKLTIEPKFLSIVGKAPEIGRAHV